jgi:Ricin-type beta-trefoil lectin domain
MKRQLPRMVVTILVALLAVLVIRSAGPVQAQQEIRPLENLATGFCLDSNADGDVYTLECTDDNNFQLWTVGSGFSTLENFATGRCLDSNADGDVYTLECTDDNDFQLWNRFDVADGIVFQNLATGRCLDSNTDGDVYTLECTDNNSFQKWR